jgi:hypothetical protein
MSLNKEIDDQMEAIELAFKRGKLTEEQALEFLEISSYRTGEILHHGSPTSLTGLNPNRPLAMTYSDDIANRYAEAGMKIISAARIQERLTGRAGRLPRNIQRSTRCAYWSLLVLLHKCLKQTLLNITAPMGDWCC